MNTKLSTPNKKCISLIAFLFIFSGTVSAQPDVITFSWEDDFYKDKNNYHYWKQLVDYINNPNMNGVAEVHSIDNKGNHVVVYAEKKKPGWGIGFRVKGDAVTGKLFKKKKVFIYTSMGIIPPSEVPSHMKLGIGGKETSDQEPSYGVKIANSYFKDSGELIFVSIADNTPLLALRIPYDILRKAGNLELSFEWDRE